ncbi:Diadenosine tetraphosphate (Ap4A) hydrolase-liker HIT family hydrolase [Collimonas fungivorans Ter331]|uniref:Diadenosine tetraphosphate (Ap4A) hydrolase-liker HIT family hydrolase n=2 Tax=Collimonas fungivorans TaxID=158899 RepID=G0A8F4_COLFT|nr:Diadenosine tetraphosphate (Ap4A) hydrolase-liker HIT family hydrolase [Collimonas fungivorans Ter331]
MTMANHSADCELCSGDGGEILLRAERFRVVLVDDAQYPGFCRVIWHDHVKEMTDLPVADRSTLMAAVCKVESVVRAVMQPEKINLASLGNMTPHLHWHVIPRYPDDAHFPSPVWAESQRQPAPASLAQRQALLGALRSAISEQF